MVTKFDIEKFSYKNNLRLWRFKLEAILIQQSCANVIKGAVNMSTSLSMKEKIDMIKKARSIKIMCLGVIGV